MKKDIENTETYNKNIIHVSRRALTEKPDAYLHIDELLTDPGYTAYDVAEMIQLGVIESHLVKVIDGCTHLHKDLGYFLVRAYEMDSEDDEFQNGIRNYPLHDAIEDAINHSESNLYYYEKRIALGCELDQDDTEAYTAELDHIAKLKMLQGA